MRKNRARKGRELELQGPDSQPQSASSSPAWQADMHSKGYNGQPCASGVCILNLEGKKGEAGEELIKSSNSVSRSTAIKQLKIWIPMVDTAQIWKGYSCVTAACSYGCCTPSPRPQALPIPPPLHTLLCGTTHAPQENPELLPSAGT